MSEALVKLHLEALEEGGYVLEQGDRFELTPRGIRRVGQLALRDIYQQLRRDGMGRHSARYRGSQEIQIENSDAQKRAVKWRRRAGQNSSWRLCRL